MKLTWTSSAMALSLALTSGIAAAPAAEAQKAVPAGGMEEIIVTARKKEENIQSTPIAITAVGAADLDSRGAATLQALDSIAPNVHFSANQPTSGLSGATSVFIRGIGQRDFTINIDPAVGIYFDGVYLGRTIGALMDLADVERVEVLRGPQNTLFGRNTIGGAVNVITRRPGDKLAGEFKLAGGEEGYLEVAGNINVPFDEKVRATLGVFHRQQDGYVDALQYDGALKLGEDHVWGARGKLAIDFTDSISLDVSADYSLSENTPAPVVPLRVNNLLPVGTVGTGPFNTTFNNSVALSGTTACATAAGRETDRRCYGTVYLPSSPYATNSVFTDVQGRKVIPENSLESMGVSATLAIDTPIGQIKSITAYRQFDAITFNDVDFSPFLLFANNHPEYLQDQFSQELQLVGEAANGKIEYVAGLYHFKEDGLERTLNQVITAFNPVTNPGSLLQDIFRYIDNTSDAAYGQLTVNVTDKLSVTGGLRYTKSEKKFTLKNVLPTGVVDGPRVGQVDVERTTPMLTVGYKANDASYLYATYSEGFRDGGFAARFIGVLPSTLPSYNPEFVKAFEIGSKNVFFDKRLRLNLALFHTDYSDLQVDATVPPGLGISQQSTILNLASAKMQGVEVEFDARPTPWLRLDGALGYLDAQIETLTGGTLRSGAFTITTASKLPMAPERTANLGVTVSPQLGELGKLFARLDLAYTDDKMSGIENNPEILLKARTISNASLRFVPDNARWEFGLRVANLTDEKYFHQIINIQALNSTFGAIARPRTLTASVKYKFGG